MSDQRIVLGRHGEDLAAEHLAGLGMSILGRNWRCARGEIDLIAQDVIVEVRSRSAGSGLGSPEESIGFAKRRRMRLLAERYLLDSGWMGSIRIDVVTLIIGADGLAMRLTHYPNALSS